MHIPGRFLAIGTILLSLLVFISCGSDGTGPQPSPNPKPQGPGNHLFYDAFPYAAGKYAIGEWAVYICADDMSGNGSNDLVTIDQMHGLVCVFLNYGDGTFAPQLTTRGSGSLRCLATGDLDGDQISDVALVSHNSVSFLSNNGDGSLQAPSLLLARGAFNIVTCDLDGDLDNDLAFSTGDTMCVMIGNGNGTFHPPVEYEAGGCRHLISSDLDGDSDVDLVAFSDSISIFLNDGDGTFTLSASDDVNGWTYTLAACDLDGDGDNDLTSERGSIWLNNGDGTFQPPFSKEYDPQYAAVYSGDLDGDDDFDLAYVSYYLDYIDRNFVSVYLNNGDATFTPAYNYGPTGLASWRGCLSDLDGDGDEDMAVVSIKSGYVAVLFNTTIR